VVAFVKGAATRELVIWFVALSACGSVRALIHDGE
jgi:hypothetical protein